jgi:hypothetical protein
LSYIVPRFKKTKIQDCIVPVISNVWETAAVTGNINIDLGVIDKTFEIPKISCSSFFIPSYETEYNYFNCATYSASLSVSYYNLNTNCVGYSGSLGSSSSYVSISFNVPTYSTSTSNISLKSYGSAYFSSSSERPRNLVRCNPGGYNVQPPTPTWTNTGRAKLLIEVVYRPEAHRRLEFRENTKDGYNVDPENDLCIYVRDYETGSILEKLDNSIEFWAWCTAKDAQNTFNDPYLPHGNKVTGDPRYDTNPVELIKANLTIERHHGVENLLFIDTKLNRGHLQSNEVKNALPYEKTR